MKNNRVSSIRSPEFSPPPAARKHKGDETSSGTVHVLHSHRHSDVNQYQRSVYLNTAYMRKKITRDMESEDQRNARLAYQRERSMSNRSSESVDQKNARLTNLRKRSASNRLSKSAQRKSGRLMLRQQHSEVIESTDERQHIVEQNQIKNIQHQQRVLEKKQQLLLEQYNWPAAIPTQLKEYCLQDFCNHTPMSALRQSICIVCNIRASATTMKEYALPNIPKLREAFLPRRFDGYHTQNLTNRAKWGSYF